MILENSLIPWIGKTGKLVAQHIDMQLRLMGSSLSAQHWLVLRVLSCSDGQSQNDLALITDRNKTSLARLLATMERKKYIYRSTDLSDGRTKRVFLTDLGKVAYTNTVDRIRVSFEAIQNGLTAKEIAVTKKALQKIQRNILHNIKASATI